MGRERAPGLVSERDGDQARLPRGLGAGLGLEHEPAVVLAVAEGTQLDFAGGQAALLDIPPAWPVIEMVPSGSRRGGWPSRAPY